MGKEETDARKRRRLGLRDMESPLPVIAAIFHQKSKQEKRPFRYFSPMAARRERRSNPSYRGKSFEGVVPMADGPAGHPARENIAQVA
jgi:hypothetical protein